MLLEVKNLGVEFEQRSLLAEISMDVRAGECHVILGENGAGKSLLMRCLADLLTPTQGKIIRTPELTWSFIEQRPSLLRQTVLQNLRFAASTRTQLRDSPDLDQKIAALLQQFDLSDKQNQSADTLSKGLQQRLALAIAVLLDHPLLLLDEPTSALDPQSRQAIQDYLRALKAQGKTLILITHHINFAAQIADIVHFLAQGCLIEQSPARDFFARPQSAQAGEFLATFQLESRQ